MIDPYPVAVATTDESAVRAVLDAVYAAWADNDADAFVAPYALDATAVHSGTVMADREAIRVTMASGFAGPLKGSRGIHRVLRIRFVGADTAIVATRAGVRLALIASLQHLPGRQRAVLILRDVLGLPAAEVAEMLEMSSAAVKSALQRARARIDHVAPQADELAEPSEPRARELLQQYMAAFERADLELLERALRADATLEMTSSATWFSGNRDCLRFIWRFLRSPGEYRMLPTRANGQFIAAAYRRDERGVHHAFALVVLTATSAGIARITLFNEPRLFAAFGFPPVAPVLSS